MRDIHCPKDIGFENTFSGEDCEKEQHYNNCYHCWSTAIASRDHQQNEEMALQYAKGYNDGFMEGLKMSEGKK